MALRWGDVGNSAARILELALVSKALDPNNPADYLALVARLKKAILGLTGPAEAAALKQAIGGLDADWSSMSEGQIDKVVEAARAALKRPAIPVPKLAAVLNDQGKKVVADSKKSTSKEIRFQAQANFDHRDAVVVQAIAYSQANYVRDAAGQRSEWFGREAKRIISEGVRDGQGRQDIAARLQEEMTALGNAKSKNYWTLVAGTFANRARTYGHLSTYQRAGIHFFRYEAVMDEVTSAVCRFMHGKRFPVADALEAFTASETVDDPEMVKATQPWVSVGRDDSGNQHLFYRNPEGDKTSLARVEGDGKFSGAVSDQHLNDAGIMVPPLHGHCRSRIVADAGESASTGQAVAPPPLQLEHPGEIPPPVPVPPEKLHVDPPKEQQALFFGAGPGIPLKPISIPVTPPVQAFAPAAKSPMQVASEKLAASDFAAGKYGAPFPLTKNPIVESEAEKIAEAILAAEKGKKKQKELDVLLASSKTLDAEKVRFLVENPGALKKEPISVVKIGKGKAAEFVVVEGHEAVLAKKLLGQSSSWVTLADYEQWKKQEAEKAASAAAAEKQKAQTAAIAQAAKQPGKPTPKTTALSLSDVTATKVGAQGGSNEGGFYVGKDGVKRYVKLYSDPAQAHGEVLANQLYRDLGFGSPSAVAIPGAKTSDGRPAVAYASTAVSGQPLGLGPSKAQAREFFKGFAADVLTANWDAAGAVGDNAFQLPNGQVIRIDNGGSFLARAKRGRKPLSALDSASEIDGFFPGNGVPNPGYHAMARAAGYSSVDDFKDDFRKQVESLTKLRDAHGGWANYVNAHAAGMPEADRATVARMMEKRHAALIKRAETIHDEAPTAKPSGLTPLPSLGHAPPIQGGVRPRPGLRVEDIPHAKSLPIGHDSPVPRVLPHSGEDRDAYSARADAAILKNVPGPSYQSIQKFTGNDYRKIRDSEFQAATGGKALPANSQSDRIQKAFEHVPPTPGTTYRGIRYLRREHVDAMLASDVVRMGVNNTPGTASSAWHSQVAVRFMAGEDDHASDAHYKVLFQIRQKSGIAVETISKAGRNETEVLLPKHAKFKVHSVARWPGKQRVLILDVEEID